LKEIVQEIIEVSPSAAVNIVETSTLEIIRIEEPLELQSATTLEEPVVELQEQLQLEEKTVLVTQQIESPAQDNEVAPPVNSPVESLIETVSEVPKESATEAEDTEDEDDIELPPELEVKITYSYIPRSPKTVNKP
jgi:uncharacterized membrane protein